MPGNIILRSYLDLDNGALENTVNYTNERGPSIAQSYSSLRRFTKIVGNLKADAGEDGVTIVKSSDGETNGTVFTFTVPDLAHSVEQGMADRLYNNATLAAGVQPVTESSLNSLVYHEHEVWSKYLIDFGPDLLYPKYLAFFNLDDRDVYICKAAQITQAQEGSDYTYTLVPFLLVPGGRSVGPVIFNPKYGNLFVVSDDPSEPADGDLEEQDLYVIAYNN